jgi:hypothetical protein
MSWCASQESKVNVLWGQRDIDNMRKREAAKLSDEQRDNIKNILGDVTSDVPTKSASADDDMEEPAEKLVDDFEGLTADEIEAIKARTLDIKANMTQNSAPMPGYKASCDWLGIDYKTREVRLPSQGNSDIVFHLKSWQPIGKFRTLVVRVQLILLVLVQQAQADLK